MYRIIINYDIPADEDVTKTRELVLSVIQSLKTADKIDTAEVNFTDISQGVFKMQVKFWIKKGINIVKAKSDALLSIKEELDKAGIRLTSPTSINVINSAKN